jgi:hypothetical protein
MLAVSVYDRGENGALYFIDLTTGREMGQEWRIVGNYLTLAFGQDGGLLAIVPFDPEAEVSQWTMELWAMTSE